jgi:hypothetical protein
MVDCGAETPIPAVLMRIHRVAMLQAFVHFPVHHLASWVRHLDQQRRQNHRHHLARWPESACNGGITILYLLKLLLNFGRERLNCSKITIK